MASVVQPLYSTTRRSMSLTDSYTDESTQPSAAEQEATTKTTTRELESLSTELLLALYQHQPIHDKLATSTLVTPEFRAELEGSRPFGPKHGAHFEVEIVNTSADVHVNTGKASVYVFFVVAGGQKLVHGSRERVDVWDWERTGQQDRWRCVRHTGLHGPAGFA